VRPFYIIISIAAIIVIISIIVCFFSPRYTEDAIITPEWTDRQPLNDSGVMDDVWMSNGTLLVMCHGAHQEAVSERKRRGLTGT